MKKLLVVGVFLNAAVLIAIWHEVSAVAQGGPVATTNGDVNGSGEIDIADAQYLLNWLFLGGPDPVAIALYARKLFAKLGEDELCWGINFTNVGATMLAESGLVKPRPWRRAFWRRAQR